MTPPLKPIPTVRNPGTAAAMIAVASSQLGYAEGRGNLTAYSAWYGMQSVPWCNIFVSWVAKQAGCSKIIARGAYTPATAQYFKDRGQWHHSPKVGDIVYYDTAGLGRISHVGIVEKVNADRSWVALEGNTDSGGSRTGGSVMRIRRRTVGSRGGFGRPAYAKVAASEKPPVNLESVVRKAKTLGIYDGRVAAALKAEGHPATVAGYAAFQRSLGLSGADADGVAGARSLTELGSNYGWQIKE